MSEEQVRQQHIARGLCTEENCLGVPELCHWRTCWENE